MPGTTLVFRLFHFFAGILWMGGVVMLTIFILPSLRNSGPAGWQVMHNLLVRAKLGVYLPTMAILTILSGFALFWQHASVPGSSWSASTAGVMYSIGGAASVVAFLVGGIMIGRSATQLAGIGEASGPSGGTSTDNADQIALLQARMQTGSRIATGLLVITAITMAVGRYV